MEWCRVMVKIRLGILKAATAQTHTFDLAVLLLSFKIDEWDPWICSAENNTFYNDFYKHTTNCDEMPALQKNERSRGLSPPLPPSFFFFFWGRNRFASILWGHEPLTCQAQPEFVPKLNQRYLACSFFHITLGKSWLCWSKADKIEIKP